MTNEEIETLRRELANIQHLAEFGQSYDLRRLSDAVVHAIEAATGVKAVLPAEKQTPKAAA